MGGMTVSDTVLNPGSEESRNRKERPFLDAGEIKKTRYAVVGLADNNLGTPYLC